MRKKTLGIDPATKCGFCVLDCNGNSLIYGLWNLSVKKNEADGFRYLRMKNYLESALEEYSPDQIAFEQVVRHMGTQAAHVYGGIVAVLKMIACERGIPYVGMPVKSVKKFATGNGNATKQDMVDFANKRWCLKLSDKQHDTADALWIAEMASA